MSLYSSLACPWRVGARRARLRTRRVCWLDGGAATAPPTISFLARYHPKHEIFELGGSANRELAKRPEHGSVRHVELSTSPEAAGAAKPAGRLRADRTHDACYDR